MLLSRLGKRHSELLAGSTGRSGLGVDTVEDVEAGAHGERHAALELLEPELLEPPAEHSREGDALSFQVDDRHGFEIWLVEAAFFHRVSGCLAVIASDDLTEKLGPATGAFPVNLVEVLLGSHLSGVRWGELDRRRVVVVVSATRAALRLLFWVHDLNVGLQDGGGAQLLPLASLICKTVDGERDTQTVFGSAVIGGSG